MASLTVAEKVQLYQSVDSVQNWGYTRNRTRTEKLSIKQRNGDANN
jgi:hypothetical protein